MQFSVLRQTLDGCHRMTANPLSRKKAAMDRLAVEPDSASAAIARVASFFHSKPSQLAKKCSQALTRPRRRIESLSINGESHFQEFRRDGAMEKWIDGRLK